MKGDISTSMFRGAKAAAWGIGALGFIYAAVECTRASVVAQDHGMPAIAGPGTMSTLCTGVALAFAAAALGCCAGVYVSIKDVPSKKALFVGVAAAWLVISAAGYKIEKYLNTPCVPTANVAGSSYPAPGQ